VVVHGYYRRVGFCEGVWGVFMYGWIMKWDTRSNCSRVVSGIIVCEFIVYSCGGIYLFWIDKIQLSQVVRSSTMNI
jgi:hypothetical protein